MAIQLIIDLFVLLIFLYYLSVGLHSIFGVKIFATKELRRGKAIIPFYYWLHKPTEEEKKGLSFEEKLSQAEETVRLAKEQVEDLSSEAYAESKEAKGKLHKAKKSHEKALKNLELLKKTKF